MILLLMASRMEVFSFATKSPKVICWLADVEACVIV